MAISTAALTQILSGGTGGNATVILDSGIPFSVDTAKYNADPSYASTVDRVASGAYFNTAPARSVTMPQSSSPMRPTETRTKAPDSAIAQPPRVASGSIPPTMLAAMQQAGWTPQQIEEWAIANGYSAAAPPLINASQPGELNVPYGADYLNPTLSLYGQLAALQQGDRQFQQNALFNAAQTLASLYAQGPQSAAELAFSQAGMGLPAVGGSRAAIEDLIGASTRGATGQATVDIGGQGFSVPNTLSGQQMQGLSANPNLAGVLGSFAKAAGNPDIFRRSIEALVPSNFQAVGSGLF